MYGHFLTLKKKYDDFYKQLLKNGVLPMRSTDKGFWSPSIMHEIYPAFERLKLGDSERFLDLGSGDGAVVLTASLFGTKAEGVECDDWLVTVSQRMQRELSHLPRIPTAVFHKKDFQEHDISGYDTIFINPDAPFHRGVEGKLLKELKGRLIVYGHEYLPQNLKEEQSFILNGTRFGVYRPK